jgi:DNA-binding transcriptional MerR regulator
VAKPNIAGWRTEEQEAARLGKTVRTLRSYRTKGIGPAWAKFGNTVLYKKADEQQWLDALVQQPVRSRQAA